MDEFNSYYTSQNRRIYMCGKLCIKLVWIKFDHCVTYKLGLTVPWPKRRMLKPRPSSPRVLVWKTWQYFHNYRFFHLNVTVTWEAVWSIAVLTLMISLELQKCAGTRSKKSLNKVFPNPSIKRQDEILGLNCLFGSHLCKCHLLHNYLYTSAKNSKDLENCGHYCERAWVYFVSNMNYNTSCTEHEL